MLITLPLCYLLYSYLSVCLGPTLKLKRSVVSNMYKETIASLYAEPNTA